MGLHLPNDAAEGWRAGVWLLSNVKPPLVSVCSIPNLSHCCCMSQAYAQCFTRAVIKRGRAVMEPRAVLASCGVDPATVEALADPSVMTAQREAFVVLDSALRDTL